MIVTLPNLVSLARLALVPVFLWLLFGRDDATSAGILIGFVGATDWVDGYLARRLGQVSEVGKVLDPLADRLAVAAAVIGGWVSGAIPAWFAIALMVREATVAAMAGLLALRTGVKLEVRYLGKLATFILYFAFPAFFVAAGTGGAGWRWVAWTLAIPGLVLYWAVAVLYGRDTRRAAAGRVS